MLNPLRPEPGQRVAGLRILTKWVARGIRSCFDKALLSEAEGLSTNGFNALQLFFRLND